MPTVNFTVLSKSVAMQIDNGPVDYIQSGTDVGLKALSSTSIAIKGVVYDIGSTIFKIDNGSALTGNAVAIANALQAVFPSTNSGNGGSGASVQRAATKAAANALTRVANSFVRVAADESNNGDKSMYLDDGTTLEFQYTIS
ncbi:hypothetical protein [Segetibacter aerophilus]|uniref:Uncharacterized protein n=1 Tax=Segetibacter aerophilus TaxID=670293 RepID=A0A512BA81_9BACT|nr:hypothetical protein [Segetibacter aerophilus]GEO08747.1 hypothetical protein SAE01_12430 [Segetibacter aerophilus]